MNEPSRLWRRSRIVLLALALAAIVGALIVMYFAFYAFVEAGMAPATQRYMAGLALVVVALLVIALFCLGILMIRYLAYGLLMRRSLSGTTEYVDAWKLAGERFKLEGSDADSEGDGIVDLDPFEGDFDADEAEEDEEDDEEERGDDDLLGR